MKPIPHPWWHWFFTDYGGWDYTDHKYGPKGVIIEFRTFRKNICSKCQKEYRVYDTSQPDRIWEYPVEVIE